MYADLNCEDDDSPDLVLDRLGVMYDEDVAVQSKWDQRSAPVWMGYLSGDLWHWSDSGKRAGTYHGSAIEALQSWIAGNNLA